MDCYLMPMPNRYVVEASVDFYSAKHSLSAAVRRLNIAWPFWCFLSQPFFVCLGCSDDTLLLAIAF